jgi:predicted ester cyclase
MLPARDTSVSGAHLERIRTYYACFNERRFHESAALFAADAVLEQVPFHCRERGGAAYLLFADTWTRAFPDARLTIGEVVERPRDVYEIGLIVDGTHQGDLAMGGLVFKPTGVAMSLRMRELLEFRGDRIAVSCLSFDLQELAHQLARVDDTQLLMHLSRLRYLEEQLRAVPAESARRHALLDRIGRELDAARQVARPYFAR